MLFSSFHATDGRLLTGTFSSKEEHPPKRYSFIQILLKCLYTRDTLIMFAKQSSCIVCKILSLILYFFIYTQCFKITRQDRLNTVSSDLLMQLAKLQEQELEFFQSEHDSIYIPTWILSVWRGKDLPWPFQLLVIK